MVFRRKIINASLLTLLYVALWSSVTLNYHTHIINGELISHSHPFAADDHEHSNSAFQLLDTLILDSIITALVIFIFGLTIKPVILRFDLASKAINNLFNGSLFSLRAPPSLL